MHSLSSPSYNVYSEIIQCTTWIHKCSLCPNMRCLEGNKLCRHDVHPANLKHTLTPQLNPARCMMNPGEEKYNILYITAGISFRLQCIEMWVQCWTWWLRCHFLFQCWEKESHRKSKHRTFSLQTVRLHQRSYESSLHSLLMPDSPAHISPQGPVSQRHFIIHHYRSH